MSKSRCLARERGIGTGACRRKNVEGRMDSTVEEGRFQGKEEGQAKRIPLGEVEESLSG